MHYPLSLPQSKFSQLCASSLPHSFILHLPCSEGSTASIQPIVSDNTELHKMAATPIYHSQSEFSKPHNLPHSFNLHLPHSQSSRTCIHLPRSQSSQIMQCYSRWQRFPTYYRYLVFHRHSIFFLVMAVLGEQWYLCVPATARKKHMINTKVSIENSSACRSTQKVECSANCEFSYTISIQKLILTAFIYRTVS